MPRFQFEIYEKAGLPSQHWLDLETDTAAIAEARRAARELVEDGGYRLGSRHRIEVRNGEGTLLAVVPLRR